METDRVAVVTGAAQGIGRELVLGLVGQGYSVACVDIQSCDETLGHVKTKGGSATSYRCDIANEDQVLHTIERIGEELGPIKVLVNNAAVYDGLQLKPTEQLSVQEWDRVMTVNARGTFLCCRAVIPSMKQAHGGKIINLASGSALRGSPFLLHYVSSKGAIIALTRALATELGPSNIQVNAVAPGFIQTDASRKLDKQGRIRDSTVEQQSLKRPLQAADIAGTVLYLASSWSDAVTGQVFAVDGGLVKN